MIVKLLTEHHLEFLSLKGADCTGLSESTLVKMSHCWKSHVMAHIYTFISYLSYQLNCCALPDKRCLSHGMLPLSGHDDVALFE